MFQFVKSSCVHMDNHLLVLCKGALLLRVLLLRLPPAGKQVRGARPASQCCLLDQLCQLLFALPATQNQNRAQLSCMCTAGPMHSSTRYAHCWAKCS